MGTWRAEKTITLDNLTGCWLPDTYTLFGDKIKELGLDDTRTIMHDQRFLLTTNDIDPKVYQVTKIVEVSPVGILKISLKQDEVNWKRDNIELKVCDYYTNVGDTTFNIPSEENSILDRNFRITELLMNENKELIDQNAVVNLSLHLGQTYFYQGILDDMIVPCIWQVEAQGDLSEKEKKYAEGLIKLVAYNGNVVSIKSGKANSLIGKTFKLTAAREDGEYVASINLGVIK